MTDTNVETFIPSFSSDALKLIEEHTIKLDLYSAVYEVRKQDFVDRLKKAVEGGRFEITGRLQARPTKLVELVEDDKDKLVILRQGGYDNIVKAGLAMQMITEVTERQDRGHFTIEEIVNILADISLVDVRYMREQAQKAFETGKLIMFNQGFPVDPVNYDYPVGSWGEYSTPGKINQWLQVWGAECRFPCKDEMPQEKIKPKGVQQEEAIVRWLEKNEYDPQAIPKAPPGKGGIKETARDFFVNKRPDLFSKSAFDNTWKRLRKCGTIKDQES